MVTGWNTSDMIRHLENGLAQAPKKGVASCDKPRVGASILRSEDPRIGYLPAVRASVPLEHPKG